MLIQKLAGAKLFSRKIPWRKKMTNDDYQRLLEINNDPEVKKEMPGHYKDVAEVCQWINDNNVYAIRDNNNQVVGFVQLYELNKSLKKRLNNVEALEISFALPSKFRTQAGMVSNAVRQVCAQNPNTKIVGFAHPDNFKSIRVLERCGFVYSGKVKYHGNDKFDNLVYTKKV